MIDLNKNNEPLDLSYLKEMSGDSAEFIIEMIDLFKSQTPVYIAELQQAIDDKEWSKAAGFAHKIKPTFVYVGREDAKAHMQMMEDNASSLKDVDSLPSACDELVAFVEVLYGQLDKARAELEKQL
ncbi:Hpt domain-containing protein [Pedobacter frigoris]|uniref:Hpt domain-containing protein n=1 Tax=Pedobacter frigoris TaxID=2571272 RepID=A0A4U1CM31_9SPHI|nr:Hpt domain-containing protein [Pedobacter frigoris]TKC08907.1 Hpt domain-containing protein [Pedobacter frigoris]